MKHYSTLDRIRTILILIALAANVVIWSLVVVHAIQGRREPDVVYPMTNQHIEWTWAGKDGAGR